MGEYLEQQYEERDYALELAKKHNLLPEDNSNMTWEELKEKAKEMGYIYVDNDTGTYLFNPDKSVSFCRNGCFVADSGMIGGDVYISRNRTYDQMLAIMNALQ